MSPFWSNPKEPQKPAVAEKAPQDPATGKPASPGAEILQTPTPRASSKRPHPPTPAATPTKPVPGKATVPETGSAQAPSEDEDEPPKVLNFSDMSKLEKEKVRRIVSPKKATGNLEVPENIFEMWKDAGKGRDKLFRMWCKAGGVKASDSPNISGFRILLSPEFTMHYIEIGRAVY